MADTIKLKKALEGHTHVLPFHYTGTGRQSQVSAVWDIIRGRTALWFGKNKWGTIPAQEVRDLADQVVSQSSDMRDALSRHKSEIKRYQDAIDTLNSRLPEADRLQKIDIQPGFFVFNADGSPRLSASGGSGGTSADAVSGWLGRNPPPLPEPPIGYAWPKVATPDPLEALETRVAALEALWRPFKPDRAPLSTPQQEPGQ